MGHNNSNLKSFKLHNLWLTFWMLIIDTKENHFFLYFFQETKIFILFFANSILPSSAATLQKICSTNPKQ